MGREAQRREKVMGTARMGRALRDVEEGLLEVSRCRAGRQVGGGELV